MLKVHAIKNGSLVAAAFTSKTKARKQLKRFGRFARIETRTFTAIECRRFLTPNSRLGFVFSLGG